MSKLLEIGLYYMIYVYMQFYIVKFIYIHMFFTKKINIFYKKIWKNSIERCIIYITNMKERTHYETK